ncbi:hypothetical protein EIP86_007702 [Pleurotus ostreatoroseus]|nr:hypothetical protein EIP86_007702 [Pleurotus ostreatoroseus]
MAEEETISDALTNEAVPRTSATLTIRIVKSFEFRTEKSLVLKNVNCETTTVGQLKEMARQGTRGRGVFRALLNDSAAVQTQPGWKPYRNATLGTPVPFLLHEIVHQSARRKGEHRKQLVPRTTYEPFSQTTNLIINLDHDEWILDDDSKILADLGFGEYHLSLETLRSPDVEITENETEVSFFSRELYEAFKQHPEVSFTTLPIRLNKV